MSSFTKRLGEVELYPWLCAVLLFFISFPKWFWGFNTIVIAFFQLALLMVAFRDIIHNRTSSKGVFGLVCQLYILFVTTSSLGNSNINGYILMIISWMGFSTLFLCSAVFWKKCVDCFVKILGLLLIVSLVEHIAISFLNIELVSPYVSECPINAGRDYNVYAFNVYLVDRFYLFNRFYAFYDEPGVLGNIMMCLLFIQKFDLKKWYNIVFLISGVLSFSLAFYIAVAAYFMVFGNMKSKVIFAILVTAAVVYFYNNEILYDLVFGRFEFEDGQMAGYNRENYDFDSWIKTKNWTEYFLWGYQPSSRVPYAASWLWAFALYGIIPSLIYLCGIIYPRTKYIYNKKDLILGLLLVAVIWIQRPFISQYLYVFLITIPFVYLQINQIRKHKVVS